MADRVKRPRDFKANPDSLLPTPPPPVLDPSTRKKRRAAIRERKKRFDAAHRKGMTALRRHDLDTLDEAIKEEASIIAEQGAAIKTVLPRKRKLKKAKKKR